MLLWHINYYELKAPGKQQIQERHSDLLFIPESRTYNSHVKSALLITEGRKTLLSPEKGNQGQEKSVQTNLVTLTLTFLRTSPQFAAPSPNPFVLPLLHKLFLCLKGIKGFCSRHFLNSSFFVKAPTCMWKFNKNCMLFHCKSVYVNLILRPSQRLKLIEENFFSPTSSNK